MSLLSYSLPFLPLHPKQRMNQQLEFHFVRDGHARKRGSFTVSNVPAYTPCHNVLLSSRQWAHVAQVWDTFPSCVRLKLVILVMFFFSLCLCLCVCVSVSVAVCVSLSVSVSVSLTLSRSLSVSQSLSLSVCLCLCLSVSVSRCLSVSLSLSHVPVLCSFEIGYFSHVLFLSLSLFVSLSL